MEIHGNRLIGHKHNTSLQKPQLSIDYFTFLFLFNVRIRITLPNQQGQSKQTNTRIQEIFHKTATTLRSMPPSLPPPGKPTNSEPTSRLSTRNKTLLLSHLPSREILPKLLPKLRSVISSPESVYLNLASLFTCPACISLYPPARGTSVKPNIKYTGQRAQQVSFLVLLKQLIRGRLVTCSCCAAPQGGGIDSSTRTARHIHVRVRRVAFPMCSKVVNHF